MVIMAGDDNHENGQLLQFAVAGVPFAVPATSVTRIISPPSQLTHTPGSTATRPGIFEHEGRVYAEIDLRERFALEPPPHTAGKLLLFDHDGHHHAFVVDTIIGLADRESGRIGLLPPGLPRKIFWGGFIQKERLTLCTRLDLLLAMEDAAPFREQLRRYQHSPAEGGQHDTSVPKASKTIPPRNETPTGSVPSPPPAPSPSPHPGDGGTTARRVATTRPATTTPRPSPAAHRDPGSMNRPTGSSSDSRGSGQAAPRTTATTRATHRPAASITEKRSPPRQHREVSPPPSPVPPSPVPTPDRPAARPSLAPRTAADETPVWPLLLAIAAIIAAAALYLLWPEKPASRHTPRPVFDPVERPSTPSQRPPAPRPPDPQAEMGTEPATVAVPAPTPLPRTPDSPTPVEPEPLAPAAAQAPVTVADEPPPPSRPSETSAAPLPTPATVQGRIRVDQSEQGITLIIEELSEPEPTEDRAAENSTPAEGVTPPIEEAARSQEGSGAVEAKEADAPAPPDTTPRPRYHERRLLHIVVSGDTLWDIANRYLDNPWRFPELAKQSGIHNPDRIYPGDRVRIIIRRRINHE